ncbi:protein STRICTOSIDINE SYNTHASE-LIKE 10-like, partial [Magnolia sinica]|uniref:protein STRICTOSIDINE SYNTHASE-LIKE 10-like n=1 Tax=Magnolia sinica TaxID=86752 RepID=UPI00265817E1
ILHISLAINNFNWTICHQISSLVGTNIWVVISGDRTGRLLKYDPRSKEVTVLLEGLAFGNGVAISKDSTFLLIVETTTQRILRFWLQGSKAGALEVFTQLSGYPDNIKRNPRGEFWVATTIGSDILKNSSRSHSHKRKTVLTSIRKSNTLKPASINDVIGMRFNENGEIMEVLNDKFEKIMTRLSEVEENNGSLWLGSVVAPDVGIYKL